MATVLRSRSTHSTEISQCTHFQSCLSACKTACNLHKQIIEYALLGDASIQRMCVASIWSQKRSTRTHTNKCIYYLFLRGPVLALCLSYTRTHTQSHTNTRPLRIRRMHGTSVGPAYFAPIPAHTIISHNPNVIHGEPFARAPFRTVPEPPVCARLCICDIIISPFV